MAQRDRPQTLLGAEFPALEKVPPEARVFGFWDQAALWFGAASLPAAWYYGALMAGWTGLPGAFLLIFVVSTLTFVPWAFLGRIAAKTGACSMAMVRPTFGLRGSALPSVFYLIFGFGWGAVNVFLGGIAMSYILKGVFGWPAFLEPGYAPAMVPSLLLVCLLQGIFAVAGYRWIRWMEWLATAALLGLGVFQTVLVLRAWQAGQLFAWAPPAGGLTTSIGPFTYALTFALLVDLLVAYNWTWEFIGDFSRFATTPAAGTWGPFVGANVAQYWWFSVGALGVAHLALTTGKYRPELSDPSTTTTQLGFGWIAYLVILAATVATNAGNIYASALGISNMLQGRGPAFRLLLGLSALGIVPLALLPLLVPQFVGFYIFWLDFLGAIVIPLWTIALVDYFLVKRERYTDDLFRREGGLYWYRDGWNWPAVVSLLLGTGVYWVVAFGVPRLREALTATLPTVVVASVVYFLWARRREAAR
ncbi:MAG: cytosine permease [candidate division NC10 bacterium]|nr:cytosine permease [candidate division NC10 bacterium]